MPDLTHDTAEDGFHEIQLSGKQLVFLFMATTVVLVVVFLCGVLVGRGVPGEGEAEQSTEVAAAQPGGVPDAAEAPPVSSEAPTPAPGTYKYPDMLTKEPGKEELKAPDSAPRAEAPPPRAAAAEPPPAPATPPPAEANVPTSGRAGTWFLQVTALKNRPAAADTVRKLIAKGYPAYLENPAAGEPIYRVRIGRYRNRDEAEQVARRLQKEEQFTPDIRR